MHLMTLMTPDGTQVAPDSVLKLIKCNCKSVNNICGESTRCSCATNSLRCTKYCNCDVDGVICSRSVEKPTTNEMEENS